MSLLVYLTTSVEWEIWMPIPLVYMGIALFILIFFIGYYIFMFIAGLIRAIVRAII